LDKDNAADPDNEISDGQTAQSREQFAGYYLRASNRLDQ